jgi:hypothetical protein
MYEYVGSSKTKGLSVVNVQRSVGTNKSKRTEMCVKTTVIADELRRDVELLELLGFQVRCRRT